MRNGRSGFECNPLAAFELMQFPVRVARETCLLWRQIAATNMETVFHISMAAFDAASKGALDPLAIRSRALGLAALPQNGEETEE